LCFSANLWGFGATSEVFANFAEGFWRQYLREMVLSKPEGFHEYSAYEYFLGTKCTGHRNTIGKDDTSSTVAVIVFAMMMMMYHPLYNCYEKLHLCILVLFLLVC
jgi:hypothetical protein